MYSLLQKMRMQYEPRLPDALSDFNSLMAESQSGSFEIPSSIGDLFPKTRGLQLLSFKKGAERTHVPLRVGVVLSGGQAAGGHNVICGLYDALKKLNHGSKLFGFVNGPIGIIDNQYKEIHSQELTLYRNQGGFDLIGSGRTKIETQEHFEAAAKTVKALDLDGLVVIGGDDSNTNAALLAEYFSHQGLKTKVAGVPKTIDGDLKNRFIEISFGFDTASKTYAEIIGNTARDALSAQKLYFFVKMMGRSASHLTLECALQTHPNIALIGEEIAAKHMTLQGVTNEIADMICARAQVGKNYGMILIPEGIVEFIPEVKALIKELNNLLQPSGPHHSKMEAFEDGEQKLNYIYGELTIESRRCLESIPQQIQLQMLLDRDPHGNVSVSKIETEKLLIETVTKELKRREQNQQYRGKFSPQAMFCGYEGRSALPSNFDAQYCYTLGHVAALLIDQGANGYMCCVRELIKPVDEWQIAGIPLVSMMDLEVRHGKSKPVIHKALVDLDGDVFQAFCQERESWKLKDSYMYPGPIQFFGPEELTEAVTQTLAYEAIRRDVLANSDLE